MFKRKTLIVKEDQNLIVHLMDVVIQILKLKLVMVIKLLNHVQIPKKLNQFRMPALFVIKFVNEENYLVYMIQYFASVEQLHCEMV